MIRLATTPGLHTGDTVHVGHPAAPAHTITDVHRAGAGLGPQWEIRWTGDVGPHFFGPAVRFFVDDPAAAS